MRRSFTLYMRVLAALGGPEHAQASHGLGDADATAQPQPQPQPGAADFAQADERARVLGEQYRGAGIVMVGLGTLIVLCAVAPHALASGHGSAWLWGLAELGLMLAVVALWYWLGQARLRDQWVQARRTAEWLRHEKLHAAIQALSKAALEPSACADMALRLSLELKATLDAQISYNLGRHAHYERIEHGSARVGVAVFVLAMAAAVLHLFLHWPWLLFLTAVGPMLAGAVHGINGFLRLADLSDDHRDTAQRLQQLQRQLGRPEEVLPPIESLLAIARATYRQLADRDAQWHAMANTIQPKLG